MPGVKDEGKADAMLALRRHGFNRGLGIVRYSVTLDIFHFLL